MFPIATLAFMGLLLGLGCAISSPILIENIPFLENEYIQNFFKFLTMVGSLDLHIYL